jgi:hypothetical protein
MPENTILITQPFGGLSDDQAFGDQPAGTTREALNVRGIDPVNGRTRMAQRAGLSKYNTNVIEPSASKKIQDLNCIISDNRQVTYTNHAAGSEETVWSLLTAQQADVVDVKVDRQSNLYLLDEANRITKVNKAGTVVFSIAIPTADAAHVCRELWIDQDDGIYVGVSRGGDQSTARMWKFRATGTGSLYEQVFQIETGLYVKGIRTFGGLMVLALDDDPVLAAKWRCLAY